MDHPSLLPATWQIPRVFRDRLGTKVGRQRSMAAEEHLLLVVHRPPRSGEDNRVGRFIWRTPEGDWTSNDLGSGPQAVQKHLAEYAELVEHFDRLEEQADEAEDYFRILRDLSPLLRSVRNLHQVLQEARRECPEDRHLINFRDRAYEIERTADLLYDGTKHALDYVVARRGEELAKSSQAMALSAYRLNLLVAFFFPLATLAAVFGMNVENGLERLQGPWPLIVLLVLGLTLGLLLRTLIVSTDPQRTHQKRKNRYGP